jgi:hypothetical protein
MNTSNEESLTVLGKDIVIFQDRPTAFSRPQHGENYAGGFLLEEGGWVVIAYRDKPTTEVIKNYRKLLGWVWISDPKLE